MLYLLDSIVVSIPACHAGDRGSIPRRGALIFVMAFRFFFFYDNNFATRFGLSQTLDF